VSSVYLIRHGQAGTRDAYDSLSALGRRQARLLGEYFASQGIKFAAAYSGELLRQRQTAEEVRAGYGAVEFPELTIDSAWNEFDLNRMYQELAPRLCEGDAHFRCEYEALQQRIQADGGELGSSVHRRWLPCDTTVVNAWMDGTLGYGGETWEEFRRRVGACRASSHFAQGRERIAVFSSATPIAIWVGLSLDIEDGRLMKLAGVLHNASFSMLQLRNNDLRLFNFNATPHLASPELRTFR
jgi:broad specificity phosphatase PhoE